MGNLRVSERSRQYARDCKGPSFVVKELQSAQVANQYQLRKYNLWSMLVPVMVDLPDLDKSF
jgi:hypothetical protein